MRLSRATRETNAASFTLQGSEIVIRVELEDIDDNQRKLEVSAETTLYLRNP